MARNIKKKLDINNYSLAHLTLILSLHYLVKFRSRSLAVYNNEFMGPSALAQTVKPKETTKSLKICHIL